MMLASARPAGRHLLHSATAPRRMCVLAAAPRPTSRASAVTPEGVPQYTTVLTRGSDTWGEGRVRYGMGIGQKGVAQQLRGSKTSQRAPS